MRRILILLLLALFFHCRVGYADDSSNSSAEEAAIKAAIKSYVDAFNRGDAKALASHWTEGGELATPAGETIIGRANLEKDFAAYFEKYKGARIELIQTEISLLSPGVAIERGTAKVVRPDEQPSETEYEAVHVRRDSGWKMDSVREADRPQTRSHYEHLKDLEWMIGDWIDADQNSSVETTCQWTKNRNFMTRSFKVSLQGEVDLEGTQVIGWDPVRQAIRSWLFDSDGGFGVGLWSRDGSQWTVQALRILHSGEQASAINILTYIDDNTFKFKSTGRQVGGELMPNIREVTVVRK